MIRNAVRTGALLIALAVVPLTAAAASLVGSWQGVFTLNGQRCTISVVMNTNASYVETLRCGTLMTQQSGTYKVFPNGEVGFNVVDWSPKQQYVVGAQVGSGHYEALAKPPGGLFKYSFSGPNTMVWRDVNFGGTITLQRG
jgi:hypothetical protein